MLTQEQTDLSSVNAAILIARRLAHARLANDPARFAEIVDCSRYCQLLASRSGLRPLQTHRANLAAWLSALDAREDAVKELIATYQIEGVLLPPDAPGPALGVEAHILKLVKFYQDVRKRDPGAGTDIRQAQHRLETEWAASPDQHLLVRRLVKILKDEAFLAQAQPAAGRILIVDPEEAVSPFLAPPLSSEGYEVHVVGDVSDAERNISLKIPDVVISEMNLPLTDGIVFCCQLKQNAETARIPVLIVTSNKSKPAAKKCLRAGAEDVLTKPVDLETLFLKLKRLVARPEGSEAGDRQVGKEGGVAGSLSDMSFTDMIQIVTAGGKSMAIAMASGDKRGEVVIRNGEVVHARVGDTAGENAFYEFMRWRDGTFTMHQCADVSTRTIQTPVMSLLMEGSRLLDEGGESPGLPPKND